METENPQPSPSTVTRGEESDDASYYVEKLTIEEALLPEYVEDEDEELGEEGIAALQKMVAPFGKKDAPAVLMEAIGYIKFLHDQIAFCMKESEIQPPPGLRTRGLCLVPLSRTDYNFSQESSNDY